MNEVATKEAEVRHNEEIKLKVAEGKAKWATGKAEAKRQVAYLDCLTTWNEEGGGAYSDKVAAACRKVVGLDTASQ